MRGFPYVCIKTDMDKYPDRCVPWHWHSSCEIVTVEKGDVELKTPDTSTLLHRGDAVFVNKGVLHTYFPVGDEPVTQYAHLFHTDFLSGTYNSIFEEKYFQPICRCAALQSWVIRPDSQRHLKMISAMLEAMMLVNEEPDGHEFDIRTQLCIFWKGLFYETEAIRASATVRNLADLEQMKQMLEYIQEHYYEPLTVENIASSVGISARECNRCFHRCIDASPMEHLTYFRIRKAAIMLEETAKTIMEVSEDCGLSNTVIGIISSVACARDYWAFVVFFSCFMEKVFMLMELLLAVQI